MIMRQDKRRFTNKLDYVTSPGYLSGPKTREKCGLPRDCGPWRVITQLGVYGFEPNTKKMELISPHPGKKIEDIMENSSFPILIPDRIGYTQEPTAEEIRILKDLDTFNITFGGV
jgi:glutaconate CoA-transferase subunit B